MQMRQFFSIGLTALLLALLLPGLPCSAQEQAVERIGNAGTIDWVSRKLTATGTGVSAKKAGGQPHMRAMVKRAAIVVARRNLLEVVKGVHIDSTTRVQNFMVKSDTIASQVKGVLSGSSVDRVDFHSNGSATATVSIPLTGSLEQTLMRMVLPPPAASAGRMAPTKIDARIRLLENRVRALEQKIGRLQKASVSHEQVLMMFRGFTAAWLDYLETGPVFVPAGLHAGASVTELQKQYTRQEALLGQIKVRLDSMAARLKTLEKGQTAPVDRTSRRTVKYTGLVIDARNTGFRPCLRPAITGRQQTLYPGDYINRETAIRSGYVRYYRNLATAQRSSRAGNLPLTIKATGAVQGSRSLSISAADFGALKKMSAVSGNFLASCRVIIVF